MSRRGHAPATAAVELSRSLFSAQRVPLGVEHSLATGPKPCGLWVDAERARFVRRPIVEILNSRERMGTASWKEKVSLGEILLRENDRWLPALRLPKSLDRFPSEIFAGCARKKFMVGKFRSPVARTESSSR